MIIGWVNPLSKLTLEAGLHDLFIIFDNDLYIEEECDRNLFINEISFSKQVKSIE